MGKTGVLLNVGLVLLLFGACPLLYIYMYATWVPPERRATQEWSEILSKMFNFSDAGCVSLMSSVLVLVGFILFVWGLVTTFREKRRT